jgi:hypothetical protein
MNDHESMNDHQAIEAINQIFDKYCENDDLSADWALFRIGRVLGLNIIAHKEGKP